MTDMIARLKVDSSEYDAKIQRAARGIQDLARTCHEAGGILNVLEDENRDYIRSLGTMQTVAQTTRGKIAELTSAFIDIKSVYNSLSEEEKNGEFGKELNRQLDIMKQRISEGKTELNNAISAINNLDNSSSQASSILDQLASKFVINIDALKLFNMGLSAAKAALKVAKDAFFESDATLDEWGRTVQSSQALYAGFLNAINNGDISGYLSRMNDIVIAAREAYNAMDTLGTMKTIQAPQISAQQTENERLRMMIQTGHYIERQYGKRETWDGELLKNGQVLTPEQIRAFESKLDKGIGKIVDLTKNEVDQTGKAIDAYYNSLAKQNGMTMKEFREGTASWAEFSKKMAGYDAYKEWDKNARIAFAQQGGRGTVNFDRNNPYAEYRKWGTFMVDKQGENSYNELVGLIKQRDQQTSQVYGMVGQAYRAMNRVEGITVKGMMGGTGRGGTGGGKVDIEKEKTIQQQIADLEKEAYNATAERRAEIAKQVQELDKQLQQQKLIRDELHGIVEDIDFEKIFPTQEITAKAKSMFEELQDSILLSFSEKNMEVDETSLKTLLTVAMQNGIAGLDPVFAQLQEKMAEGMDIPDTKWKEIETEINNKLKELGIEPIKIDVQTGNLQTTAKNTKEVKLNEVLGGLSGGMSQIVSGIEQLGIEVPNELKAVVSGIQAVSSILTGISAILTVIEAVTSADALIPFGRGGIVKHAAGGWRVPGNNYADDVPALLTSGELILNRAQQGNLASQLQGNMSNLNLTATISGEQIRLALNNASRRRGRGEYVTSKTIR